MRLFWRCRAVSGWKSGLVSTASASAPQQRKSRSRSPERESETISLISKGTGASAQEGRCRRQLAAARKHGSVSSLSFCQRLASRNQVRNPSRRGPLFQCPVAPHSILGPRWRHPGHARVSGTGRRHGQIGPAVGGSFATAQRGTCAPMACGRSTCAVALHRIRTATRRSRRRLIEWHDAGSGCRLDTFA